MRGGDRGGGTVTAEVGPEAALLVRLLSTSPPPHNHHHHQQWSGEEEEVQMEKNVVDRPRWGSVSG